MGSVSRLVPPDVRFHRSFLTAMIEDPAYFAGHQLQIAAVEDPAAFARYVTASRADAHESTARPPGFVPQTVLWWVEGEELLSRLAIRHRLTRRLRSYGGHIGYWTRPSARGRGHATAAFRAALCVAYDLGLDPVLLTCDHDNQPSRRVIEGSGGCFEQRVGAKRLYWVPTRPSAADRPVAAARDPARPV